MNAKTQETSEIIGAIRQFLFENLSEIEDPDALDESTSLITGGILDSVTTVSLVNFLEECYELEFKAHEINVDNLDRITDIARTVMDKLAGRS